MMLEHKIRRAIVALAASTMIGGWGPAKSISHGYWNSDNCADYRSVDDSGSVYLLMSSETQKGKCEEFKRYTKEKFHGNSPEDEVFVSVDQKDIYLRIKKGDFFNSYQQDGQSLNGHASYVSSYDNARLFWHGSFAWWNSGYYLAEKHRVRTLEGNSIFYAKGLDSYFVEHEGKWMPLKPTSKDKTALPQTLLSESGALEARLENERYQVRQTPRQ